MTTRPIAILKTSERSTRMLIRLGDDDVMKAILPPPPSSPHPRAMATLLEGIALWHQAPVRVVLAAADLDAWYKHGLVDDTWATVDAVHYTVEVRYPDEVRQRIEGLGSFRDLRQLALGVVR